MQCTWPLHTYHKHGCSCLCRLCMQLMSTAGHTQHSWSCVLMRHSSLCAWDGNTTNAMKDWRLRSPSQSSRDFSSPQFQSSSPACEVGKPSADSEPPPVSAAYGITCGQSRERLHSGTSLAIEALSACPAPNLGLQLSTTGVIIPASEAVRPSTAPEHPPPFACCAVSCGQSRECLRPGPMPACNACRVYPVSHAQQ